jgi:GTP-binding protein YchF
VKLAFVGLPGGGKTTLFNALAEHPVDLLPGVPGAAPHVSVVSVRDARLEWLRDHYKPEKYTPATLVVEDHPGIPPGSAKADRRGEHFARMRNADGLVVVVRAFATGEYAYDDPAPDPARDLDLVGLEFLSADHEICERRLERLEQDWKKPKERDRVEREQAAVRRLAEALEAGRGAHTVELRPEEEALVKGFQLLTRKPVLLIVNLAEGAPAPPGIEGGPLRVAQRFDACLRLEAELAALDGEERDLLAADYGIAEPLRDRFQLAAYRALGLRSFFTVGEDEVRAWTIEGGDDAVTAAGKIHTDLARGFIRAEVTPYESLHDLGSMKEVKAKGKQRLEGKEYEVADGDILNIRFSV